MKFLVALGVLAFAISADAGASMHNPRFCYATDTIRPMTNMASYVSSYEAIRRFNFTTINPYVSTCTPSRVWYFGRYGARLPQAIGVQQMIDFAESSIQDNIVSNYEAGRTSLCRQDYESIRDFTTESDFGSFFRIENAALVTESGVFAMQNISRRFQQVFPNIFTAPYTPDRYHFRHTSHARTNTSIRAFATGLFGEVGSENVIYEPLPEVDWLLRPMDFCPAYTNATADWNLQREAFSQGPEMQEMVQQVNSKLGFHASNQMDFDQIFVMWNWCRYKVATTFEASNSETVAHHLLFEYYEDLGFVYLTGYGVRNQRLIENLNCGVVQDLLRHMHSESDADTLVRVFITDVQQIHGLLVALGAFRDVWPMHQHNFAQQSGRNWLTSLISPLSSNLAVVRFDCDDGDHDLIFVLNERPILVPGCNQKNGVCKLSVLVNRFRRFINADCSTFFCSSD